MHYRVVIVTVTAMNWGQMATAMEDQMNRIAEDGYKFVAMKETDTKVIIVMGKQLEAKRGRPSHKEDGEALEMS